MLLMGEAQLIQCSIGVLEKLIVFQLLKKCPEMEHEDSVSHSQKLGRCTQTLIYFLSIICIFANTPCLWRSYALLFLRNKSLCKWLKYESIHVQYKCTLYSYIISWSSDVMFIYFSCSVIFSSMWCPTGGRHFPFLPSTELFHTKEMLPSILHVCHKLELPLGMYSQSFSSFSETNVFSSNSVISSLFCLPWIILNFSLWNVINMPLVRTFSRTCAHYYITD
jgi:hypothetical protein